MNEPQLSFVEYFRNVKGVYSHNDVEKIVATALEEQKQKFINQKANQHDAMVRADEREKTLEEVLHQLELTIIFGDQAQQEGIIEPDWVGRLNEFLHYYRDQLNQLKGTE